MTTDESAFGTDHAVTVELHWCAFAIFSGVAPSLY